MGQVETKSLVLKRSARALDLDDMVTQVMTACTAMTIRMYADRKSLPLDGVGVTVSHARLHAADCEACLTQEGQISRLTRTVRLDGDLDEATRARLLEIADRCPIHRTLEGDIQIVTEAP